MRHPKSRLQPDEGSGADRTTAGPQNASLWRPTPARLLVPFKALSADRPIPIE
jgi:hypothetical protein